VASPISVEDHNRFGLRWFALADEEFADLPTQPVLEKVVPIAFSSGRANLVHLASLHCILPRVAWLTNLGSQRRPPHALA